MNGTATQNNADTLLEDIRHDWDQVRALPNEVHTLKNQLLKPRRLAAATIRSNASPPGSFSDCGLWTFFDWVRPRSTPFDRAVGRVFACASNTHQCR